MLRLELYSNIMRAERESPAVRTSEIVEIIHANASWVLDSKGKFDGKGRSPSELLGPCIDYLISLQHSAEQNNARVRYKDCIAEITTPEEKLRFISGTIWGEWQKNMP